MNCINCRQPHNGNFILVLGMFELCDDCVKQGEKNEQMLQQGIVIERVDPKTFEPVPLEKPTMSNSGWKVRYGVV